MKTKLKTLPADFKKLIEANDLDALKKVFDICELDAREGYYKTPALSFRKIPDELVRWLVDQGADINAVDTYQATPLHAQAAALSGNIPLFLERGANIEALNYQDETPLHSAVHYYRVQAVRDLIAQGANVQAENKRKETPLAKALKQCRLQDLEDAAEVTKILLDAGAAITPEMKKSIQRIGKEFEFIRAGKQSDHQKEASKALLELYRQFDVEPAAELEKHDGISPIHVKNTAWPAQHQELWEFLVPASGYAQTVQGEVIRITGRISDEILGNGGANWDENYRSMLNALISHLSAGNPLPSDLLQEAAALVRQFQQIAGYEQPSRLSELAVQWVLANPQPMLAAKPDYSR